MSTDNDKIPTLANILNSNDGKENFLNQAKEKANNFLGKLAFWKKDLTDEEKLAKTEKELEKIEKKYHEAMTKAETETDEEKAAEMMANAENKRTKAKEKLEKKYPDQMEKIQNNPIPVQTEQNDEGNPEKKNFWQKLAFWKKDLTEEEKLEKDYKKIEKAYKKYQKAIAKAEKETDAEKAAAMKEKALDTYSKKFTKISENLPIAELFNKHQDDFCQMMSPILQKDAETIKQEIITITQKTTQQEKHPNKLTTTPLDEKMILNNATLQKDENANTEVQKREEKFDNRIQKKDIVNAAKSRVAVSPEKRKEETLKKWMKEAKLPESKAAAMIDKYGLDMAYKLTQRCMLEPNNLMPEVDNKFKKIDNKSFSSINYFLELDTTKKENQDVASRVTGLKFTKDEQETPVVTGTNKSNMFLAAKMRNGNNN